MSEDLRLFDKLLNIGIVVGASIILLVFIIAGMFALIEIFEGLGALVWIILMKQ